MARRLAVVLSNGTRLVETLDLTGVPNCDARSPLTIVVQRQCDMGSWHNESHHVDIPCYDGEEYRNRMTTAGVTISDGPAA